MSSRHSHDPIGPVEDRQLVAKAREEQASIPMGIVASGTGIFIALIGFGVIPVEAGSVHAPMWIIQAAGASFFFAGIAVAFNSRALASFRFVAHIFGFLTFVSMMSILYYFVYMRPGVPAVVQWSLAIFIGFFALGTLLSYIPGSGVTRVERLEKLENKKGRKF